MGLRLMFQGAANGNTAKVCRARPRLYVQITRPEDIPTMLQLESESEMESRCEGGRECDCLDSAAAVPRKLSLESLRQQLAQRATAPSSTCPNAAPITRVSPTTHSRSSTLPVCPCLPSRCSGAGCVSDASGDLGRSLVSLLTEVSTEHDVDDWPSRCRMTRHSIGASFRQTWRGEHAAGDTSLETGSMPVEHA
jgi:hypothetical protein